MFIPRINLKIFKTKGQGKVHAKNMNSESGKFPEIKELTNNIKSSITCIKFHLHIYNPNDSQQHQIAIKKRLSKQLENQIKLVNQEKYNNKKSIKHILSYFTEYKNHFILAK